MYKKAKMQTMVFQDPTTYSHDYKEHRLRTSYKVEPPPRRRVLSRYEWKPPAVPFDLMHRPRPIVQTSPWDVQEHYEKPKQTVSEREEAQRTRPRLVMTPAVSMDDVVDPSARAILCEDMYCSSTSRALREAAAPQPNLQASLAKYPAPANPIALPKLQPLVVTPEWRMQSVQWDRQQYRGHCDSTKQFWEARLPKCPKCDEAAAVAAHRKMLQQKK